VCTREKKKAIVWVGQGVERIKSTRNAPPFFLFIKREFFLLFLFLVQGAWTEWPKAQSWKASDRFDCAGLNPLGVDVCMFRFVEPSNKRIIKKIIQTK
jgi:hypothetical protein